MSIKKEAKKTIKDEKPTTKPSKKPSVFESLLNKLDIDETLTKPVKKEKAFHHVKDSVNLNEDYNFMADLLFLPTTKLNYRYLLCIVDLATDEFDIEPIKDKEPKTILSASKTIFKRKHLNKPYASIRTDQGNEFKGVFHKYLYDESIFHSVALPERHTQLSNMNALTRQLGRLLNGYMNTKELKLNNGKPYKEWVEAVPIIREELNKIRKKVPIKNIDRVPNYDFSKEAKYKIGDLVYRLLDRPETITGERLSGKFREGDARFDKQPRKIEKILLYSGGTGPYRYIVSGLPNASYTEAQLMPAKEEEELFEVKQLLSKKIIDGKPHILTWYYGELKKEASYQPVEELNKFVPDLVKQFEESLKKPKKKKV